MQNIIPLMPSKQSSIISIQNESYNHYILNGEVDLSEDPHVLRPSINVKNIKNDKSEKVQPEPKTESKSRNIFGTIIDFISNIDSPIKHDKVPTYELSRSMRSESSEYANIATEHIQTKNINDFGLSQSVHHVSKSEFDFYRPSTKQMKTQYLFQKSWWAFTMILIVI